jgi:hypothetical protein
MAISPPEPIRLPERESVVRSRLAPASRRSHNGENSRAGLPELGHIIIKKIINKIALAAATNLN